jgi:hypothetical protein
MSDPSVAIRRLRRRSADDDVIAVEKAGMRIAIVLSP